MDNLLSEQNDLSPIKSRLQETVKEKKSDSKKEIRTVAPNERTEQPNALAELSEGVQETKRATERYSFEIYSDLIGKMEDLQYRYKKRTGKKLSSSRIIREALEEYLKKAEEGI